MKMHVFEVYDRLHVQVKRGQVQVKNRHPVQKQAIQVNLATLVHIWNLILKSFVLRIPIGQG